MKFNYDYLDRLETDNVPESAHNIYPQACKRPLWLIEAAELVDKAWKFYDQIVEDEIFADRFEYRVPRYNLVREAREDAEDAQAHYSAQWERWQKEVAEKLEVKG